MIPKFSSLKQPPCYYISWFCGSGIWIWFGWVIILLCVVSQNQTTMLVTGWCSAGGWSGKSETASLTCLAPWSDGWQAGLCWDWEPGQLHMASSAWWPQESQISCTATQGPRVSDLANKVYAA